jgi:hypothetical protein
VPLDQAGMWRLRKRNGHLVVAAAVLSMAAGIVLLVAGFAHAFRLGYGRGFDEIPLDAIPHARLGLVLVALPGAVAFIYACWAYWRFDRTH